jgi:uncharacterized protein (UPF0276 family)
MPADAPAASTAAPHPLPGRTGIGLRAQHHEAVLATRPEVGWFEAHSENYFARGGSQLRVLGAVRERYPLSLHGVGLSLGGTDPLDVDHLAQLKRLVRDFEPALVSEHASWSSHAGIHYNDLLPLPYTEEALRNLVARVRQVQDVLGRRILVENVSSYLEFRASEMREPEFLAALVEESDCGLLLDVNNVYVSATNHGFDAYRYLELLPRRAVGEIHLAGHARVMRGGRELLIDDHGGPVCDAVWRLYAAALERFGDVPSLIEWDTELPPLPALVAEARRADACRASARGAGGHAVAA